MSYNELFRIDFVNYNNQCAGKTRVVPRFIVNGMQQPTSSVYQDIYLNNSQPAYFQYPVLCDLNTAAPEGIGIPGKFIDVPDYAKGTYKPVSKAMYMPIISGKIPTLPQIGTQNIDANNIFQDAFINSFATTLAEKLADEVLENINAQQKQQKRVTPTKTPTQQDINADLEKLIKFITALAVLLEGNNLGELLDTDKVDSADRFEKAPKSVKQTESPKQTEKPKQTAKKPDSTPDSKINDEQQKLINGLKNLIDGVDDCGIDSCSSKGQRKERILKYIEKLDAKSLKAFFKENPEYIAKLHDNLSGFFNSDDELFHQISKKLIEARREQYKLGEQPATPNARERAEEYAKQLINLNLDDPKVTNEYKTRLANDIASLGYGGKVYQEILDLDLGSRETKASINFIKLLVMAD